MESAPNISLFAETQKRSNEEYECEVDEWHEQNFHFRFPARHHFNDCAIH